MHRDTQETRGHGATLHTCNLCQPAPPTQAAAAAARRGMRAAARHVWTAKEAGQLCSTAAALSPHPHVPRHAVRPGGVVDRDEALPARQRGAHEEGGGTQLGPGSGTRAPAAVDFIARAPADGLIASPCAQQACSPSFGRGRLPRARTSRSLWGASCRLAPLLHSAGRLAGDSKPLHLHLGLHQSPARQGSGWRGRAATASAAAAPGLCPRAPPSARRRVRARRLSSLECMAVQGHA